MLRLILFRFNRIDIAANGGSGWVPLLLWGWRRRTTWQKMRGENFNFIPRWNQVKEIERRRGIRNRQPSTRKRAGFPHLNISRFPPFFVFDLLLLFFVRRVACSVPSSWYPEQACLYRISFLHPRDDWNVLIINQQQNEDLVSPLKKSGGRRV